MYDCNLIKSRAQKMQDYQLPSLESTYSNMLMQMPMTPGIPMAPGMPMTPGMPMFPMPTLPSTPMTPAAPSAPTTPMTPTTPAAPAMPRMTPVPNPLMPPSFPTRPAPTVPTTPVTPAVPSAPAVPAAPVRPTMPTFPPAPPEAEQIQTYPLSPLLPKILPASPNITVPPNPLLPPAYANVLDYESLQYLNGYLRTQIGKYVEAEFLVGSSNTTTRFGRLVGVGLNYILIEDLATGDISACDFYNIKFFRTHALTDAPPNR